MRFAIGPYFYRLRITADPIIHDGSKCLGICCEEAKEIWLSPDCPPRDRLSVLLHELAHAWIFSIGLPGDLESWCDLIASACSCAIRDLSISGGEEALMRLDAGESPSAATTRIALSNHRYCAICCSTIAGASVVCKPGGKSTLVDMALYCPHCNHVQSWQETITITGLPSGTPMGEPKLEGGAAITKFLKENPFACPEFIAA